MIIQRIGDLNILHIIRDLDINTGGPVSAVFSLSTLQASRGDAVSILSTGSAEVEIPSINGVTIITVPCQFEKWKYSFWLKKVAIKLIEKTDVVHIHTVWEYPTYFAAKTCIRLKKPYILRPCGMLDEWCMQQGSLVKKIYYKFLVKKIIHRSRAIHFTSFGEMDLSQKYIDKKRGFVIPIPLNEEIYNETNKFPFVEFGEKRLLFVGRIHPHKRLELILKTMKILKNRGCSVVLDIAGEGDKEYQKTLIDLSLKLGIDNFVNWLGRLKQSRLVSLYRQSYLTLLPSMHENYGNVLVEAMSQSCPVIVTKEVQISMDIVEAGTGIIVDSKEKYFASALEDLMNNAHLRNKMAKNCNKFIANNLNSEKIYTQLKNSYLSIIHSTISNK